MWLAFSGYLNSFFLSFPVRGRISRGKKKRVENKIVDSVSLHGAFSIEGVVWLWVASTARSYLTCLLGVFGVSLWGSTHRCKKCRRSGKMLRERYFLEKKMRVHHRIFFRGMYIRRGKL